MPFIVEHFGAVVAVWAAVTFAGYLWCAWTWQSKVVRRICELKGEAYRRFGTKIRPRDLELLQGEDRRALQRFQLVAMITLGLFLGMMAFGVYFHSRGEV